jgi:hypothetical protein
MSQLPRHAPAALAPTPSPTPRLPEEVRGAWLEAPDQVTALGVMGEPTELELPPGGAVSLGSSRRAQLVVRGVGVSASHLRVERAGAGVRLIDQQSTNGLIVGGRRVAEATVHPGDTLSIGALTLIALSAPMRAARPTFFRLMGPLTEPTADALLSEASRGARSILIVGEPGCEHAQLGHAIHAVSVRRSCEVIEVDEVPPDRVSRRALVIGARRSTLILDLRAHEAPVDPAFLTMLLAQEYLVRVVVLAQSSLSDAHALLPTDQLARLLPVWLLPLALRGSEIERLLDPLLAERDAPIRFADLSHSNKVALTHRAWPGNFHALRALADFLTTISRIPEWDALDWRARAQVMRVPKSTLYDWYRGHGLEGALRKPPRRPARR